MSEHNFEENTKKLVILHKHGVKLASAKRKKDKKDSYIINGFEELKIPQEKKVSVVDTLYAFYCDKCKDSQDILPNTDNYTMLVISNKKMENLINEYNKKGILEKVYYDNNQNVNLLNENNTNKDYFYFMFCGLDKKSYYYDPNTIYIGTVEEKLSYFHRNYVRLTNQGNGIFFKVDTEEDQKKMASELYDVVIDINSIESLNNEGWNIEYPKTKENYDKKKGMKSIIIGALGNQNKGKSFILGKLSGYTVPQGFTMKTKGISVRIGENENHCITILDSAGQGKPLLIPEKKEEENENEEFLLDLKFRNKLIVERFIQGFIIHKSDILILVVGLISIDEQKLLNNIKILLNDTKTLYVIHNLQNCHSHNQVQDYIDNTLKKLYGINLEEYHFQNSAEQIHKFYYKEKDKNVIHLIFVNDYCNLKSYYNLPVEEFLKQTIIGVKNRTSFSVIEECKDYFINKINSEFLEKEIKSEDFSDEENKIKIKENKVSLKKVSVENIEKISDYTPNCNYYTEENDLIINVELPGKDADIKSKIEKNNNFYIFYFQGTKPGYTEEFKKNHNFSQNLEGVKKFEFKILIPLKDIIIEKNDKGKINWYSKTNGDGIFTFKYHIAKNEFDDFE